MYISILGLAIKLRDFLRGTENDFSNDSVGSTMLLMPPFIEIVTFFGIYLKNSKLRNFFCQAIKDYMDEVRERFQPQVYALN